MKIRHKIGLTFTTIFFILGLGIGLFKYHVESDEYVWGEIEEARSAAIALAGMIKSDPAAIGPLRTGRPAPLPDTLKRVVAWETVDRVLLLDPQGRLIYDSEQLGPADIGTLPATLAAENVVTRLQGDVIRAFATVRGDDGGGPLGILVVDLPLHRAAAIAEIRLGSLAAVLVATIIGILVSLRLGRFIERHLISLNADAVISVDGKRPPRHLEKRRVQEVDDLRNAFDTMRSVLNEFVSRTRRAIGSGAETIQDRHLQRVHADRFRHPRHAACGPCSADGRWIGVAAGHFVHVGQVNDQVRVCVGRLKADPGIYATMLEADAAARFCGETDDLDTLLAELSAAFELDHAAVVECDPASRQVARHDWRDGTWHATGWQAEKVPIILHTLGIAADRELGVLIRHHPGQSSDQLIEALARVSASAYQGVLAVLTWNE